MKESKQTNVNGGISFVGLLTITFIVLKLVGVISWSWWWVISPIWISAGLLILIIIVGLFFILISDRR